MVDAVFADHLQAHVLKVVVVLKAGDAEKFWVQREGGKKQAAEVFAVPRADAVKVIDVVQQRSNPPSSYSNPVPGQLHDIAFRPAR